MASRSLSRRSAVLLSVIAAHGPFLGAADPRLVRMVGGGRALYVALLVLHDRFLVRWDAGGENLRATRAGRDLLKNDHYRRLVAPRSTP